MFKGRQFQYPTRVANKDNHDYFKQFFFLLLQSMKMNSDKIGLFLGLNAEDLYDECIKIVDSYGIGKEIRKAVKKRVLHIKVAVFIVSICKAPLKWIKYFK